MNSKSYKEHCKKSNFSSDVIAIDTIRMTELSELEKSNIRFKSSGNKSKVYHIYFRNISKHYYDVHPSSKHSSSPAPSKDCTHWCGYIPILWRPIWIQLHKIIVVG